MDNTGLPKSYEPQEIEQALYRFWEENGYFKPEHAGDEGKGCFSIVIPPPNVTGVLHMGHALDNTLQDILVRRHRMLGEKTVWIPGTDHAGIATQNVVERQLKKEGRTKEDLGRQAFVETVWDWANSCKGDILGQLRRLGVSPDWSRERFTLDDGLSRAVREAFVRLYNKGLIYQGVYIVNWCPRCVSAISDIETDYEEEESALWEIAYPLENGSGKSQGSHRLVVATTRPETMFGDVAVAVNPEDPRYQEYIGRNVVLPLANRSIPVIADDYVDTAFGTGALKITPAHDPNDFKIGQSHNLEPIWAIDERGRLKDADFIPKPLRGLDRLEARNKTEQLLSEEGYLVRKKEHTHRVGHCQRCGTTIEPLLSKQWFVKTKPLAERCLEALDKGEIRFIPERWTKDYVRWLENIQDWCISRQLWWGHQIPAWTDQETGEMIVSVEDPTHQEEYRGRNLVQDPDVLDTWFSSGLWPFSTMGWPDTETEDYRRFYPTSVLVTGFDIIFFWVARMTMFAHEMTGQSPFHTVYIHGLIRDEKGQKMSKSKGNTVDPVELIDEVGCDGFRFGLASLVTYGGQDIKLARDKVEQGKLFGNKLWNASRFVLMNILGDQPVDDQPIDHALLTPMDRWILSRYNTTVKNANALLNEYKFGETADLLYEFTWNGFCDWYVEYAKKQLREPELAANTRRILLHVLNGTLRLLHPIMPYVTETIYQKLPHKQTEAIIVAPYPEADESLIDEAVNQSTDFVLETVRAIRNIRQQYNVPHQQAVPVVLECPDPAERRALEAGLEIIRHFVKLDKIDVLEKANGKAAQSGVNVVGHSRVLVPLEGLIDVSQEVERLQKKLDTLSGEQDKLYKMMSNYEFLENAPPAVVDKNRTRLEEVNQQIKALEDQLAGLA